MEPVTFTYRSKTDATAVLKALIASASGNRRHADLSEVKQLSGITDIGYSDWLLFWTSDDLKNSEIKKVGRKYELTLPEPHSLRA